MPRWSAACWHELWRDFPRLYHVLKLFICEVLWIDGELVYIIVLDVLANAPLDVSVRVVSHLGGTFLLEKPLIFISASFVVFLGGRVIRRRRHKPVLPTVTRTFRERVLPRHRGLGGLADVRVLGLDAGNFAFNGIQALAASERLHLQRVVSKRLLRTLRRFQTSLVLHFL